MALLEKKKNESVIDYRAYNNIKLVKCVLYRLIRFVHKVNDHFKIHREYHTIT